MITIIMKFCEIDDDELFDVISIFNINIDVNLTIIIILSYKSSFKFIKPSFKSNLKISHALSYSLNN